VPGTWTLELCKDFIHKIFRHPFRVENIVFNEEAVMEQLQLVSDQVHSLIRVFE